MAIAKYLIRINGGIYTDHIVDASLGIPVPDSGGVLSKFFDAAAPDTAYSIEIATVDTWGNQSDWSDAVTYTTPAVSLIWTNHVSSKWDLGIDQSLTANTNDLSAFNPEVVPRFNNTGEYIEFSFTGGAAYGHIRLTDGSGNDFFTYPSGQVNGSGGGTQFLTGYGDGDLIRLTKATASRFSYKINGGSPVTISQAFSGEVTVHIEIVALVGNIIAAPVTNIPF